LQIIWPTADFVRNSIDGWDSGGSLCFPAKNFKAFLIESSILHVYSPLYKRDIVPPHIKTYARYNGTEAAWMYLTSANMSKAAMGELQKNDSQLMIRHYEIGVLFVPSLYKTQFSKDPPSFMLNSSKSETSKSVNFPLPYRLPPTPYKRENEPWLWDVPHAQLDNWGHKWLL